jgi:Zn-dependent alcohol dehydrogenase
MNPLTLTVSHPSSLSADEVLSIVNSAVETDAPVIVQALPLSATQSNRISAYVGLGEIGLAIITQIVQAIHAAHLAKTAQAAS